VEPNIGMARIRGAVRLEPQTRRAIVALTSVNFNARLYESLSTFGEAYQRKAVEII